MAGQMIQMLTFHSRDDVLRFLQHHVPLPQLKTEPPPFRSFSNLKSEEFTPQAASQLQQPQQHAALRDSGASPASEQTPGIPVTPETAQKAKKGAVSRCADCKQRHAKCTHGTADSDYDSVPQPHLAALSGVQASVGSSGGDPEWAFSRHREMLRQQAVAQANVGTGYGHTSFQGGAQHNVMGNIFTARGQQHMGVPTGGGKYFHRHSTPSQMWSVNTGGGDLNALAMAAEQLSSHASQTEQTFNPYSVHAGATHQANAQYNQDSAAPEQPTEQYHNAMDFAHLLNSDSALGPTPPNEHPEQLSTEPQVAAAILPSEEQELPEDQTEQIEQTEQVNAELQDAAEIEVKSSKKRSSRKKSEY